LTIITITILTISIFTIGIAGYLSMKEYIAFQRKELERQEQVDKNIAIDECMKVSTVTTKEAGSERKEPVLEINKLYIKTRVT